MRVSGWMTGWLFLAAAARAQSVDEWLANFPAHTTAASGALDLPVASACLLRVDGKETRRVDGRLSILTVNDGVVTGWEAEAGRLAWNLDIPSNGIYRVTAFLAPHPARDCTLMLSFMREGKETRLNASLVDADKTSDNPLLTSGATKTVGEVKLTQGRYHLLCRPSQWEHPFEMAPLVGFRLIAKGNPESPAPLAGPTQPIPPFVPGPPATLFPTGGLDQLPQQRASQSGKTTMLSVSPMVLQPHESVPKSPPTPPTPFEIRDEPEQLRELALRLQANLVEAPPGLEGFRAAMDAGDWPGALRAYRDAFFARLKRPESQGALTENILKEHLFARGKGFLLKRPHPLFLEANKKGSPVANVRGETLIYPPAKPGHSLWIPNTRPPEAAGYGRSPDNHPFWKTEEGLDLARQIELCRMKKFLPADSDMFLDGGLFPALLCAYAVDGDREALALWCAYLDDFAMGAVDQYARYPISIRAATELEPQQFRVLLMLWRIILDERPEFARDFDPAALARFLLFAIKEYPAYTIRAKRAQLANWGIMGICDLAQLCRFFPEFRVMRYVEKETWRLWQANFFQHRTPDGENAEAWDTGHNAVDIEYARFAEKLMPPPWASPEEGADYLDQIRVNQRSLLTHLIPDGQYWPSWLPEGRDLENDVRTRWLRNGWLDLIRHEPEARRRIDQTLAGRPGPLGPPERRSDYAPYAAMAYLRDGWAPDAAMWIYQNFQTRSQELSTCGNTAAMLCKSGRILAEIHPLAVNGKPPNRFWGKMPSGGKTEVGGQADLDVAGGRFFSNAFFDFVEGVQDDPYAIPALQERGDVTGLYQATGTGQDDAQPIRDTKVTRRIFSLKGLGLAFLSDHIDAPPGILREYTQIVNLPGVLPGMAQGLEPWLSPERRIFSLKGLGLAFLSAHIDAPPGILRESTQIINLPGVLPGMAQRFEPWLSPEPGSPPSFSLNRTSLSQPDDPPRLLEWKSAGEPFRDFQVGVRTLHPGENTVSVDFSGPQPPLVANHLSKQRLHVQQAGDPVQLVLAALEKKRDARWIEENLGRFPVSARWVLDGPAVLQTAVQVHSREGAVRSPSGGLDSGSDWLNVSSENPRFIVRSLAPAGGVQGLVAEGGDTTVYFVHMQEGAASYSIGPMRIAADTVLAVVNARGARGLVLQGRSLGLEKGVCPNPPGGDYSFDCSWAGNAPRLTFQPVHAAIPSARILPEVPVFTDTQSITLECDAREVDLHFTLDGEEPTLESPRYEKPILLEKTTRVKVRPFRRGLKETPWGFDGVNVGKTIPAVFTKREWKAAVEPPTLTPGLAYAYMESDWTSIFLLTGEPGLLPVKKRGVVRALFADAEVAAIRETVGAYGLRCEGWMRAAKDGLYTFHAPEPLFNTTLDAGYDLRIWVDGEEWSPCPRPHARDTWTVPLRAGWHRVRVSLADYREKPFRNDYWMPWRPEQMATGVPSLVVEGPEGRLDAQAWAHEEGGHD